jgi:hypothetical protein
MEEEEMTRGRAEAFEGLQGAGGVAAKISMTISRDSTRDQREWVD